MPLLKNCTAYKMRLYQGASVVRPIGRMEARVGKRVVLTIRGNSIAQVHSYYLRDDSLGRKLPMDVSSATRDFVSGRKRQVGIVKEWFSAEYLLRMLISSCKKYSVVDSSRSSK